MTELTSTFTAWPGGVWTDECGGELPSKTSLHIVDLLQHSQFRLVKLRRPELGTPPEAMV